MTIKAAGSSLSFTEFQKLSLLILFIISGSNWSVTTGINIELLIIG